MIYFFCRMALHHKTNVFIYSNFEMGN